MGQLSSLNLVICLLRSCFILGAHSQLQSSQLLALLQLRRHLEYPNYLEVWNNNKYLDICYLPPSPQVNTTCLGNIQLIELRIVGDYKPSNPSPDYDGRPIPNQTLSESFSMDSFVTTLSRLTSLRVLRLVSLGIWGSLPDKIHRLSSLEFLDLSSNFLYGSIPPKIATMTKLQTLVLDSNFFNDTVPDWIGLLLNLTVLSVMNNRLKGPLPDSVGDIKNLTNLALANNGISGVFPDLSGLSSLTTLDLSSNAIEGDMPTTIFSLPNISYLNLSSNELSGSLPYHMTCNSKLWYIDISNNMLTGGLPDCLRRLKAVKVLGNCLTVDVKHQHPGSYCVKAASAQVKGKKRSAAKGVIILVGVIGGVIIVMAVLGFGFLLLCRRYCPRGCSEQYLLNKQVQENSATVAVTSDVLANARFISKAVRSRTQGIPACRVYTMEEMKDATNNFDQPAFLGEGSRGKVYKGRLQDGTQVAIRCLSLSNKNTIRNLRLRLDLMAKLRNQHLVCLLGHCIENGGGHGVTNINKVYLIYEYMPNGNLRSHLSDSGEVRTLKWPERLAILIDIAKAVHFLHTGIIPGFFNNRLKMHNILFDEHNKAKLSDYGLSIIADQEADKQRVKGGDLKSWQMKIVEDDIYSFGFILLELLIGPSVSTKRETALLNELASSDNQDARRRLVDPVVWTTSSQESLSTIISIASKCVSSESSTRPSLEDILWNLQYAAQVQATADGDQRFSSPPQ